MLILISRLNSIMKLGRKIRNIWVWNRYLIKVQIRVRVRYLRKVIRINSTCRSRSLRVGNNRIQI